MRRKHYRFARTTVVAALFLLVGSATAQVRITGVVTDADTGDPLPGANVRIEGTTLGGATDVQGAFTIPGLQNGSYNVVASFVGYVTQTKIVNVRGSDVRTNFALEFSNQALQALEVFAQRAVERETPVAATTVGKLQVQTQLGSRDIPMVLETAPSVYATMSGGGAGDARINVRGFNQRNVAVMINGVPINDMENGWVYWSNWDGVGDATSSIQLQRGLSAVNLATPSIGGTLNVLTDPAGMRRGVMLKQEVGQGGFFKTTAVASTGLMNGKYALSVAGVRKIGDGVIDGTWTDGWAYHVAASWNISSKNRLDLYALGAPQKHGQNLFRQNIGVYSQSFAKDLVDYDQDAFTKYNQVGREFNQNWAPIDPSYGGQQAAGSGTFDRHDADAMYERENFFHKPQVNLNWYSQFTDNTLLSTVVYYSGGTGGGTGTMGSSPVRVGNDGTTAHAFSELPWTWDWDATVARNAASSTGSRTILRNSRNDQWTVGAISKLKHRLSDPLSVEVGVDWRTAEIDHYREVRDLLGGTQWNCTSANRCGTSDFWAAGDEVKGLGDVVDYNFTNTVDWIGGFAQTEYKGEGATAYAMAGLSSIKYTYTNHFRQQADGSELYAETDNITGGQVKGGALVNVSPTVDVYANLGYVSKVPIFDGVIDDINGVQNPDPTNEEFYSFEGGAYWTPEPALQWKFNVYSTTWNDRTFTRGVTFPDGTDGLINLTGLDAIHRGLELEVAYQPFAELRFDGGASFNDWKYTNDVFGTYRPDGRADAVQEYNFYVDNLKVGDAPQTQMSLAATVYPVDGLMVQGVFKHFTRHFADFDPFSRTNPNDRWQSWETPDYQLFDVHAAYDVRLASLPFDLQLFAHIFNVFDVEYISDALDNSSFSAWDRDHDADDAEIFVGLPRTFNFGTRFTF